MGRPRLPAALLIVGCVLLAACTTAVPRRYLPPPATNEGYGDPVKVVAIPLPVIKTDPNEDVTVGALAAFLVHDKADVIRTMIVPQVNYNENFGTTVTLFGSFYPRPGRRWELDVSKSTRVNEDYDLKVRDETFLDGKLDVRGEAFIFTDGSARFFGFQSRSSSRNETNYADEERGFALSVGYDVGRHVQLIVGDRYRHVEIRRGAVTSLPFIRERFTPAEIPGIDGFSAHVQQVGLAYSTLDDADMPTRGLYGRGAMEISEAALGSSASYRHYTVELKGFWPLDGGRYVTAVRGVYDQAVGEDVPFLERSSLGGKRSLRGYGDNRFIDSSSLLLNLEQRIRLFRYPMFNVNTEWEAAPFLDLGAVAENLLDLKSKNFLVNPGVGFRAVVRPNVVGRVDVGFGNEGPAIFATLGYPF